MAAAILGASLTAGPACSTDFQPKACSTDGDCGANVCDVVPGATSEVACVPAASATLQIGMSAPISGPEQELGTDMKLGVTLAFDAQNAAGGIRGRKLALDFMDDEYQPTLAEANARALVNVQATTTPPVCPSTTDTTVTGTPMISQTGLERGPGAVLAFLGNVGTPTMLRAAPVSVETGTLFFGAFTGATTMLRDTTAGACAQYIFNVRTSYAEEANATVQFFFNQGVPDYTHLVSFDQDDSFGDAGYAGLVAAYTTLKGFPASLAASATPIARFQYTRGDDASVPPAVQGATAYLATLLAADSAPHTVGIMMTDTYGPAAEFIQGVRQWQYASGPEQTMLQMATRLTLYMSNVSFVGPNSLSSRLVAAGTISAPGGAVPYTQGVYVSQVVPNYESDTSDIVTEYQQAIKAAGQTETFTSLEGYIDARVFIAGMLAHQGPFTPDGLVATFEALPDLSLGMGPSNGYSAQNHQYLTSVWGTGIQPNGTFANVYFWSNGLPIQFYQ